MTMMMMMMMVMMMMNQIRMMNIIVVVMAVVITYSKTELFSNLYYVEYMGIFQAALLISLNIYWVVFVL